MSFSLSVSDVKSFTSVLDVVELLVDEVLFKVDCTGVHLLALDKGHISFIKVDWGCDYFTEYNLDDESSVYEVLVDTLQLKQVLHRGGSDDTMTISYDQGDAKLSVVFDGLARKTFRLSVIGDDYEPPSMPNLDFDCAYEVSWKGFKDSLGDAKLYGKTVRLSNRTGLGISSTGEYGEYNTVLPTVDEDGDNLGDLVGVYSLEKLNDTFKLNVSEMVTAEFGDTKPLLLTWRSVDDTVKVEYLLAPRIDDSGE